MQQFLGYYVFDPTVFWFLLLAVVGLSLLIGYGIGGSTQIRKYNALADKYNHEVARPSSPSYLPPPGTRNY